MIAVLRARLRQEAPQQERGAALVLALAMIMIISVAIVAVLAYASTSLHMISVVNEQRQIQYTADGAVQTAIQGYRDNTTVGTATGTCPVTMPLYTVNGQSATVACTVVQPRLPGTAGIDYPPYALWSVGPSDGETGITTTKNGTVQVGGPIASNEGAGATPGVSASNLDVSGYTVDSRGSCVGTIVVSDPSDLHCNTGTTYLDPGYPSQTPPALTAPNPAPTCGGNNQTLQFSPGYYTNVGLFNSPSYGSCQSGYLYFKPGVYYFDFGFDPAYTGTTWTTNQVIVGGDYKGWNPNTANSTPPVPTGGTSTACKTELDGATSGVQFIFGGSSQFDVSSTKSIVELCADPTPTGTSQQIAIYGQPSGAAPTQVNVTRQATSTNPPTPAAVGNWKGLGPPPPNAPNNLLPIGANPSAIDGAVATYDLPSQKPGPSATMTFNGYAGTAAPGGAVGISYTLNVAHAETKASPASNVKSLTVQIGTCSINVPVHATSGNSATPTTDALTSPCLAAAVASNFSVQFVATAADNKTFTENLDGIELAASWIPPAVEVENSCVVKLLTQGGCDLLHVGTNKSTFVVWGTVYAPLASVSGDFKNTSVFQFRRGIVARTITNVNVPPGDTSGSFCLGYGTATSPCVGPSRVLRLTATVGGSARVVALVQYFDAPSIGRSVKVLSWNLVKS